MTQLRQGPAPVDLWCVAGDPCEWTLTIAGDPSSIADPEWTLLRSLGGSAVTGVSSSPSVAGLVATFGLTAAESTALKALGSAAAATTLVHSFALALDGASDTKEVIAGKLVVLPIGSSVPASASSTSLTVNIGDQAITVTVSLGGDPAAAVAAHTSDATDAHDASAISFAPTGTIAATDVQAAIAEVASETIQTSVLTTSGDILTRGASAPDRITRASLAADTAFTSQYLPAGWELLPSGAKAQTIPRGISSVGSASFLTSGQVYFTGLWLRAGDSISTISFAAGGTGATLPTNQWFVLADASLNKVAITADDTTTAWAASGVKTLSITGGPYVVPSSGLYYVGILVVASVTPTLLQTSGSFYSTATGLITPKIAGTSNGSLTNPASAPSTFSSLSNVDRRIHAYVS